MTVICSSGEPTEAQLITKHIMADSKPRYIRIIKACEPNIHFPDAYINEIIHTVKNGSSKAAVITTGSI